LPTCAAALSYQLLTARLLCSPLQRPPQLELATSLVGERSGLRRAVAEGRFRVEPIGPLCRYVSGRLLSRCPPAGCPHLTPGLQFACST